MCHRQKDSDETILEILLRLHVLETTASFYSAFSAHSIQYTIIYLLLLFSIQFFFNFFHQAKKCQQFRNLIGSTRHRNLESSNENIINFAHCTTIKRKLKRYSIRIRRSNVTDFRFLKTTLFCLTSLVSLSHLLP